MVALTTVVLPAAEVLRVPVASVQRAARVELEGSASVSPQLAVAATAQSQYQDVLPTQSVLSPPTSVPPPQPSTLRVRSPSSGVVVVGGGGDDDDDDGARGLRLKELYFDAFGDGGGGVFCDDDRGVVFHVLGEGGGAFCHDDVCGGDGVCDRDISF